MRRVFLATCFALCGLLPAQVHTVIGTGQPGFSATQLNNPFGLVIGPDGALYFAEYGNHVIRRLDLKTKELSTVAGTGQPGYSGDAGLAIKAQLHQPHEIRFDRNRNLYIADTFNHAIRRIDAKTGIITTVAGTGKPGYSGDGGPAKHAMLNQPGSVAFDKQGALLICDTVNHRLRRMDIRTGIIETIGGDGQKKPTVDGAPLAETSLSGPRTVTTSKAGEVFLALREGNQLYRIDAKEKQIEWLAGTGKKGYAGDDGIALKALLNGPKGLAMAGHSLVVADTENHAIRVVDLKTGKISTVLGVGGHRGKTFENDPQKCQLDRPHGVWLQPDGMLYVGDSENHRILALKLKL